MIKCLPGSKQKLDMMLPLRMDGRHVRKQTDTLNISCPQELIGNEEDWTSSNPKAYPQT